MKPLKKKKKESEVTPEVLQELAEEVLQPDMGEEIAYAPGLSYIDGTEAWEEPRNV